MWRNKQRGFIYFFFGPFRCVNNNRDSKAFTFIFNVDPKDKLKWASNGDSLILSPELLTYWNE